MGGMEIADMQDQLVCHGCRNLLMYPRGASNVRCALCNTINMVPPPPHGMDMAHIVCGGCRTMLMYTRGASSVRCSCCQTTNLVPGLSNQVPHAPSNQVAQINCGHCRTTLMYPYGASSVKCAVCQFVTNVNMSNGRVPIPTNRPNGTMPSTSTSTPPSQTQTVVVENPMSVDESGKLVSNVVVGVTTDKK
ncbi:protein LSD1 isoform X2 [Capsella rubella]|uniref:protein LSD1 isoform X2 n=1 Tax=Capsella rubella TaxID=81985 RepID=UPI000CD52BAA|nr:protein LSD1 isoform X2 [Capsella rubella]